MSFTKLSVVFVFLLVSTGIASGQSKARESNTIKIAAAVIVKSHLTDPVIDREFCKRWLQTYLDLLDPGKLYFLASDVAEFQEYESKLPDFATDGNTEFLKLVSERFQTRAKSALEKAIQRIELPFDFNIKERVLLEYKDWSASDADRTERWRKQLKHELLVEKMITDKETDRIKFLKTQYESIFKRLSSQAEQQSLGVFLNSLCKTADPHSGYITQKEFTSFFGSKLKTYSIGLQLTQSKGRTIVRQVSANFRHEPAADRLVDCELIAIRSRDGSVHFLREMDLHSIDQLAIHGFGTDASVTLELFDETAMRRFAVTWPRREL